MTPVADKAPVVSHGMCSACCSFCVLNDRNLFFHSRQRTPELFHFRAAVFLIIAGKLESEEQLFFL